MGADYHFTDSLSVGLSAEYIGLGHATWVNYTTADPTVSIYAVDLTLHFGMKF
ncbi:MAG: hypothetical protein QM537_02520 [Candidatus Symbiobacter sp.]|nr:hypothetical protein [Candidatus Symbiobacter sp.]